MPPGPARWTIRASKVDNAANPALRRNKRQRGHSSFKNASGALQVLAPQPARHFEKLGARDCSGPEREFTFNPMLGFITLESIC
ncbi:MAG: hypothetical protein IPM46_07975 [Flavobacteriales bacterium]|nr:hypothetical protein [Flavobacteriales bacterium]